MHACLRSQTRQDRIAMCRSYRTFFPNEKKKKKKCFKYVRIKGEQQHYAYLNTSAFNLNVSVYYNITRVFI